MELNNENEKNAATLNKTSLFYILLYCMYVFICLFEFLVNSERLLDLFGNLREDQILVSFSQEKCLQKKAAFAQQFTPLLSRRKIWDFNKMPFADFSFLKMSKLSFKLKYAKMYAPVESRKCINNVSKNLKWLNVQWLWHTAALSGTIIFST